MSSDSHKVVEQMVAQCDAHSTVLITGDISDAVHTVAKRFGLRPYQLHFDQVVAALPTLRTTKPHALCAHGERPDLLLRNLSYAGQMDGVEVRFDALDWVLVVSPSGDALAHRASDLLAATADRTSDSGRPQGDACHLTARLGS